jgi:hypothetical protein
MFSTTNTNSNPLSTRDVSRLAPASLDVMQRNAGKPELATHTRTMVPAANGVLVAIQDLGMLKGQQVKLLAASAGQTAQLHALMLRWSGPLAHDIEGFDPGAFERRADQTFDVAHKATLLKRYVEENGAGLPYQGALLTELTARIEGADESARSAYTARVAVQEKQGQVRELSATFYKELVSLRRTVRWTLGTSHIDNQRLRSRPGKVAAEPPSEEPDAASTAPSNGSSGTTPQQ